MGINCSQRLSQSYTVLDALSLLGLLDYTLNIPLDLLPTCKRAQYRYLTGINIAFGLGFGKFGYLR